MCSGFGDDIHDDFSGCTLYAIPCMVYSKTVLELFLDVWMPYIPSNG